MLRSSPVAAGWPPSLPALSRIAAEGSGVLVLVNETLSAQSELEQIMAYPDIPAATRSTTETGVYRVIGAGSQILRALGVGKMRLLANPSRYNALSGFDLEVTEFMAIFTSRAETVSPLTFP